MRISGKPVNIRLIQAYVPTADKDVGEIDSFYEDMEKAIKQLKSQEIKITMGDFNAKIGNERIRKIVGFFGFGEIH